MTPIYVKPSWHNTDVLSIVVEFSDDPVLLRISKAMQERLGLLVSEHPKLQHAISEKRDCLDKLNQQSLFLTQGPTPDQRLKIILLHLQSIATAHLRLPVIALHMGVYQPQGDNPRSPLHLHFNLDMAQQISALKLENTERWESRDWGNPYWIENCAHFLNRWHWNRCVAELAPQLIQKLDSNLLRILIPQLNSAPTVRTRAESELMSRNEPIYIVLMDYMEWDAARNLSDPPESVLDALADCRKHGWGFERYSKRS